MRPDGGSTQRSKEITRMRAYLLCLAGLITAFSLSAQEKTPPGDSGTGILYGHDHSYYLTPPPGWVLDAESGSDQGLTAVFYPKGSSWADAETAMYATYTAFDTTKKETLADVIAADSTNFKSTSPGISAGRQESIPIGKTRTAKVMSYSDAANSNYEMVAYIAEKKGVVMLVISSRSKNGCINNYKTFESLVRSYRFLTDKVNIY